MIRRDFLKRLAMTAAGLLVADDALELLLEPRRKLWPGASFGDPWDVLGDSGVMDADQLSQLGLLDKMLKDHYEPAIRNQFSTSHRLLDRLGPGDPRPEVRLTEQELRYQPEGNRFIWHTTADGIIHL